MLCDYGCGKEFKFTLKNGKKCCSKRPAGCEVMKKINSDGGKLAYSTEKRVSASLRYKNLSQETKDKMAWNRGKITNPSFEYAGKGNHKGFLIAEKGHKCESCSLEEWMGKPIALELDHIDGDNKNNVKENLRLLCPNCHSITDTWRGRNIKSYSNGVDVTDEMFQEALENTQTIRQALLSLGLKAKGGNYDRAYRLLRNKMRA